MIAHSKLLSKIKGVDHAFLNHQESVLFETKETFASIMQVHGSDVLVHNNTLQETSKKTRADAIICNSTDNKISIITADCIPLLVSSLDAKIIAAVHAGWKGLSQGIIKKSMEEIRNLNTSQSELFFCIGPHIMSCCYEIREDLIKSIKEKSYNHIDITPFTETHDNGSTYLSIANWCKHLLIEENISPLNIESINHCTYCSTHGYGSYRRRTRHDEKKSYQYSWIRKSPLGQSKF